ncbi:DUF3048 domain-containing protein [Candidatus Woesebacteria bacterium]|nr:DUF3048 domain-containing protein [Candidatus Woesebacteria bacterium]
MKNKISKVLASSKFQTAVGFIGLYLLSVGISLAFFSYIKPQVKPTTFSSDDLESTRSKINLDIPKTEHCPLNGGLFTKIEKDIWETRRPLAVVLENHAESRPPSGLSRADIVYEAVAEGGVTRFLSIFHCGVAAGDVKIAPVRSARIYFIDWASEYGNKPIFMHVGGANNYSGSGDTAREARALEVLETIGWRTPKGNDFDTTYDSGFPVFWRNYERLDHPVATEHTMMASSDESFKEAQKRGFGATDKSGISWDKNFVSWKFSDDRPLVTPTHDSVSFEFWSNKPDYNVTWKYDSKTNSYLRFNAGNPHTDLEFEKTQISAKNVVVMKVRERGPVDKNVHMLYTTVGRGEALIFQNGGVIKGTWQKASREVHTKFLDEKDAEISFVNGTIWIEAIPNQNEVTY